MSTIVAASVAYSDVSGAVAGANPGDTVVIPPGSAIWSATLGISKSLTLQGSGSGTVITRGTGFHGDIIQITGLPGDVPVRVTGISFDNVVVQPPQINTNVDVVNAGNAAPLWSQIRIDHCTFNAGQYAINWQGRAYGVNDHNTFTNVWVGVHIYGGNGDFGDIAWGRNDYQAGTRNFVFTEDCTFILNNAFGGAPGSPWATYHEYGARSVMRHNIFDSSAYTLNSIAGPVDAHGNQSYWANISNDFRGTIRFEFYNNLVHINRCFQLMDARGGSFLVHDNNYICDGSTPNIIDFRDEEDDPTSVPFSTNVRSPVHWPCEDQITGSFIWNNTYNGAPQTDAMIGVGTFGNSDPTVGDPFYIQKNRDFWTKPPDPTTTTVYPAPNGQSSGSYPAPFANLQVTSYTPFQYPHPLIPVPPPPVPSAGGLNPPFLPISFPPSPPAPAPVFEDGPGLFKPKYNGQSQVGTINQNWRP